MKVYVLRNKLYFTLSLPLLQQRHSQKWVLYEENAAGFAYAPFGNSTHLLSDFPHRNCVMDLLIYANTGPWWWIQSQFTNRFALTRGKARDILLFPISTKQLIVVYNSYHGNRHACNCCTSFSIITVLSIWRIPRALAQKWMRDWFLLSCNCSTSFITNT
jgi:hypothetical protein